MLARSAIARSRACRQLLAAMGDAAAKKAKLLRQLAGARRHLEECTDPARRALMRKNIAEKERQLELLAAPPVEDSGTAGVEQRSPAPATAAAAPQSGQDTAPTSTARCKRWLCGSRSAAVKKPLGNRERAAVSHEIAEPFVLWQLLLAVVLEVALLAALTAVASERALLHVLLGPLGAVLALLRRKRCAAIRCHRWAWVRWQYQACSIVHFAWRLDRACSRLPPPVDALAVLPGGTAVLDDILAHGPDTYQKKPTNRAQIESLMECVCGLVPAVKQRGATPLVLDLGAGKALLTRAVYEALGRTVATVALDCRDGGGGRDQFYDPPAAASSPRLEPPAAAEPGDGAGSGAAPADVPAPYLRVVADVGNGRQLNARMKEPLTKTSHSGIIALSKHLCGGATDCSLMALCSEPLAEFVGASCIAPCCHQKIRRKQYCNLSYLREVGFCSSEHVGLRGGTHDVDFRTLAM